MTDLDNSFLNESLNESTDFRSNTESNPTSNPPAQEQLLGSRFYRINDAPVEEISIEFFYKPHTLTLLFTGIVAVIYIAFTRNADNNLENNLWAAAKVIIFFFMIISVIAFPSGPFIRPHPVIWRMVFGITVLYLMMLLFILFQDLSTIKSIMYWFFPELKSFSIDHEKEYGVNCSDITVEKIYGHLDAFALGHFLGWTMKAVLLRHYGICWTISITWEITELAFAHLLPNFIECAWDSIILDVLICNGLGIWLGMYICKKLEMRTYKWESIKNIHTTTGKIKRAVLQLTPANWSEIRWFDQTCTYMRIIAVTQLVIFWNLTELNTFFLKHIFEIPPDHPLTIGRIGLIGLIVAPSLRQFYTYVTDTSCKRVGTQCWVFGAIMFTETIVCVKFGLDIFAQIQIWNILFWVVFQFVISIICVSLCVMHTKKKLKLRQSILKKVGLVKEKKNE